MASMSRRVFLKCAGAAALAVTASGIQYTPYFAPNETRSFVLNRSNKL